jgi:F-type H+-transporting ATPase subunit gamma
MTERLADISQRIASVRQLGAVVGAMRGIAAARAQQARGQMAAVDSYQSIITAAIGRILALLPANGEPPEPGGPTALVLFCAEQGFAGAFSERVLAAAAPDKTNLFLIGTRGASVAAERGLAPGWTAAMPSHTSGIPKLADAIVEAITATFAKNGIDRLETIFAVWQPGHAATVRRQRLLPFDPKAFLAPPRSDRPLTNLAPPMLLAGLIAEYLHAQLCQAALYAFAAENEARMESMTAAHTQVERQLVVLEATLRTVRQEQITAEIIELAAGETASRGTTFKA